MTLEEAIKRYASNAEFERTHGNLQGCLEFKQLAEWLKELEQLREQTRLIPVSKRLPEKDDLYLICFDNGDYELSYFSNGEFCCNSAFSYSGVIAWMPLPQPYEPKVGD